MPLKKPKLFHIRWKETIEYAAVVETDWTPDEIQAHSLSTEFSGGDGRPVWQGLVEEQILEPREHVVSRELEYLGVERVNPLSITAEHLPRDKVVALLDEVREALVRKPDDSFHTKIVNLMVTFGLDPVEPGSWGVLDRNSMWPVYCVSEDVARAYWETRTDGWKLCSAITTDKAGTDHYIAIEERD